MLYPHADKSSVNTFYVGSSLTADIYFAERQGYGEVVIQLSEDPSDYRAQPLFAARRVAQKCKQYRAAICLIDLYYYELTTRADKFTNGKFEGDV